MPRPLRIPTHSIHKKYLTTRQLRERWGGVSHMFIERRLLQDPNFPRPLKLGRRIRFYDLGDIERWERTRVMAVAASDDATA
jgi:predicted DNA-binding transcriptional regulator AlpA